MSLLPTPLERLSRARTDLRMGVPVIFCDGASAILAVAAETMNGERLSDLRALSDNLELTVTARRAETLKARVYDTDVARLHIAPDRSLAWIRAVADPADDMLHPMKGPLVAQRDGDAHLHRTAIQLTKQAQVLPAIVCVDLENSKAFAAQHDLTYLNTEISAPLIAAQSEMQHVVHARLPMTVSNAGRLHIFRPEDGSVEHYAVEIGTPDRTKPVLTRLHSACFTGDVVGSLKCDCGPQLHSALAAMGQNGNGILLYLNQEGRGIGLANKMRAYSLQDQGFDTVEANHRLGFEDDERDFRIGSAILKKLGFESVHLMTNNPNKVSMMTANGIDVVERVPLIVGQTDQNAAYLATKAKKSGHLF